MSSGAYPYGPPPPAPSAAPSNYSPYGQGHGGAYPHTPTPPRGGSVNTSNTGSSRGRGGHQGSGRSDYGSPYYQHQDYTPPNTAPYGTPPSNGYWQGPHQVNAPQGVPPQPPANYPPNYAHQGYHPQPAQGYQQPYQAPSPRPPYGAPPYGQAHSPYPPQTPQWAPSAHAQPYSSYSGRGGRGGYHGDQGGRKSDQPIAPPIRMGFDPRSDYNPQHGNGYGQPYPPAPTHQGGAYQQPPPSYASFPPAPPPAHFSGPPSHGHGGHGSNSRGRGRDHSGHHNKGRTSHGGGPGRGGEKFRHRDQRPQHSQPDSHNSQKSDSASNKKKKQKTNTLGLTPGEGGNTSDGGADDETHLMELLGGDLPQIPDLKLWLAERKANYPTKQRIREKQEAEATTVTETKPSLTPDEEELEKMKRQVAKLERKVGRSKRKREANDEGDEMRNDQDADSSESEDDKPETLSTRKPPSGSLPPPPIIRADPSNHCKYYATGGTCGKKGKCRFKHDPAVREKALAEQTKNGGRKTLSQLLLLNDKDNDDMETVRAIVGLRSNGRILDPHKPEISANRYAQFAKDLASGSKSSLPSAGSEANLPANPVASSAKSDEASQRKPPPENSPTTLYQGWNLSGYGGTGLKPRELPPSSI